RRGQFEELRQAIGQDPARAPDFGPTRIHPSAGATAVGARRFLVAFNANLATGDVRVAKAVAAAVREKNGGLKNVRALGFSIENGRRAQVSMNLVDTEATPIHRVLALVRSEAARHGVMVSGCEIVGLVPEAALLEAARHALQLEGFRRDRVLAARRMPAGSADEMQLRSLAVIDAELEAARVPLNTATSCLEVAELAATAARSGNPNAATDAGVAGRLAIAAAEAALLNVKINLKRLPAGADKNDIEKALPRLEQALVAAARSCSEAVHAVMNA